MASSKCDMRIVLMGKTGSGKSAIGNSLLHSTTAFSSEQSSRSITRNCKKESTGLIGSYGQRRLTVVDTPGFFDTEESRTNDIVEKTIASEIFDMTSPGVHAFLIIISVGRFTPEEKRTVDFIKTIFGENAVKYCILIFTREDQLDAGQTIDGFINSSTELKDLVESCGNRKFAINNKLGGSELKKKTDQLLQMIDQMVQRNNDTYYTNDEYKRIEKRRREEQARKEEEERKREEAREQNLIAIGRARQQREMKKEIEHLQGTVKQLQASLRKKNEKEKESEQQNIEKDNQIKKLEEENKLQNGYKRCSKCPALFKDDLDRFTRFLMGPQTECPECRPDGYHSDNDNHNPFETSDTCPI